jgi:murein DD-endopeptidase MepM/ murein hydrolase activator NlpD
MIKLLNALLPLITPFLNYKKIEKKSNGWNNSEIAESQTNILQKKPEIVPTSCEDKVIFYKPVRVERITSPYGFRTLNIDGKKTKQFHLGVDFGGNVPIYAVEDSIITRVLSPDYQFPVRFKYTNKTWVDLIKAEKIPPGRAWTPYVILKGIHTGVEYKYKHVFSHLKIGEKILAGAVIGNSGNFGYSMGGHLHFEVWVKGKAADPIQYLSSKKSLSP